MVSERISVPLLDLTAQYNSMREEVLDCIKRVLESQNFILGPEVEAFEQEVATYCQCSFGVGVSSGTDALLVSLMAIGLRPGDEVITTPYTFFATAGAVARLGARPVFADIDPVSYNIDPSGIEPLISSRTRAIIPVHLFGQMADMDSITELARRHQLYIIEDAAQAIGAELNGRRAGSIGHLGCFSFFPSKNLGGVGDGGMVMTNDLSLAERVRLLRNHGFSPKYYNKIVGGNFRMDAIQAAVLRGKLKHLDGWTEGRRRNATLYRNLFREAGLTDDGALSTSPVSHPGGVARSDPRSRVRLPAEQLNCRHIYNQFVIRVAERDRLMAYLREQKIGSEVYYPVPLHLQECFKNLGYKSGDFPDSEQAAQETLALPIYAELTREMISAVVTVVAEYCSLAKSCSPEGGV